jgi:hydroxyacid-oxoacid transhydrogenase
MSIKVARSNKQLATSLLRHVQNHPSGCPCHSCSTGSSAAAAQLLRKRAFSGKNNAVEPDYAFEMAASNIRYGNGVTKEVGMDFGHLGIKRVALFTDSTLINLPAVKTAIDALERQGVKYDIYSDVIVEPKDYGVRDAIEWARNVQPEGYLAVGGGSVIDYAKIANLFQVYEKADLMDFVNAPVGKGLPIERKLKPLIAVPTTAGTGSETTGTAIFDYVEKKSKTGIASRALKPLLGIVDPLNTQTMPASVRASSGLDVLCHSLESYTAIPYNQRTPRPSDPILRPAYQGANPISDIFSLAALRMIVKYLPRSVKDLEDHEAQENTLLAATLAGVGFGNAGVHLCHGLSYPLSSQNKTYKHYDYQVDHPIVPHGVSVAVTAPSVFKFTGPSNPRRHLEAAEIFGVDISNAKLESAGEILGEAIQDFLYNKLGDQPRGIGALGFSESDIDSLVEGALPQRRVLNLAPSIHTSDDGVVRESLATILRDSLTV